jgi:hypothetical protein
MSVGEASTTGQFQSLSEHYPQDWWQAFTDEREVNQSIRDYQNSN